MSDKVRIGFAGVGAMGQAAHLRNYATLPDCTVVALAEPRPRLRDAVARKYGIERTYATAMEMIESERLDGIVASQPFDRHGAVITPLYAAGIPIFTEKPLADSVEVGERMLEALAQGGSWHMVGYHKRSDPATMYAKAEIERLRQSGELGRMTYVRILMPSGDWVAGGFNDNIATAEAAPPLPPDTDPRGREPFLAFINYYIHQVNLLRHLLGESYRVAYADPSGVLLAVESVSGVPGVIEMTPFRTTADWRESALVAFERGFVKIHLPAPLAYNRPGSVEVFSDPGSSAGSVPQTVIPQLPWEHAMRRQASNFVAAIRGERPPMCDAAEAFQDLQIARDYLVARGDRAVKGT